MAKQARVRRSWGKVTNRKLNRFMELFWRQVAKAGERAKKGTEGSEASP